MSSKIDTLFGFSDVCTGCGKLCTIQVTRPKNTYIYLPVINHKIVYDYIAHPPKNHDFLGETNLHIDYNKFTETTCFNPSYAFATGKAITEICKQYKLR